MDTFGKLAKYRMPAEWEPHSAVWLAWPHDEIAFPNRVEKAEDAAVKMIAAIHKSERVELLVPDATAQAKAMKKLELARVDLGSVSFRVMNYLGGWMRDNGGLWVKDLTGKFFLVNFKHNLWGNKFPGLKADLKIPQKIANLSALTLVNVNVIIEGGAIDVNGNGVCLTTASCLLNDNRNPGKTKKEIEAYLAAYLGIKKTIWLTRGLINDHTDGHIDEIARFVGPNKIVCAYEQNEKDENYLILKNNFQALRTATNLEGGAFELVKLPMPHMNFEGEAAGVHGTDAKAAVSYANFYIGNEVVLVPTFKDPNDSIALGIIKKCFADRRVIGIDCSDIAYGGGAVHCLTQQVPAV